MTDVVNLNTKKADGRQTAVKKKMIDQVATPTGILQTVNVTPLSNAACKKQPTKGP